MAQKRGGDLVPVTLDEQELPVANEARVLVDLHEALGRLEQMNTRLARVVECRFFGGMTEEETAEGLRVSDRTVRRDWMKAKAWLHQELAGGEGA
jgi:RNA polymerase sigma factor (TIGR02999 family)